MSDLTLQDLIRLEEPNVDNIKFRIARHVMKGRGWDGFDELIRFDDDLLTIFAGNMSEDRYSGQHLKIMEEFQHEKLKLIMRDMKNTITILSH